MGRITEKLWEHLTTEQKEKIIKEKDGTRSSAKASIGEKPLGEILQLEFNYKEMTQVGLLISIIVKASGRDLFSAIFMKLGKVMKMRSIKFMNLVRHILTGYTDRLASVTDQIKKDHILLYPAV
jgi:hypothetical protein